MKPTPDEIINPPKNEDTYYFIIWDAVADKITEIAQTLTKNRINGKH